MPYDENRTKNWNDNQALIEEKYWKFVTENEKAPKIRELAELTGLTRQTISAHYRDLNPEEIFGKYKPYLEEAMFALIEKAKTGDVAAIALLGKFTGFTEKKRTELDIKQKTVNVTFED